MTVSTGENSPVIDQYQPRPEFGLDSELEQKEHVARINALSSGSPTTAHLLLGKSLFQAGRYDLALTELEAALHENPELGMAYYIKGLIYTFRANFEKAVEVLEFACRLETEKFGPAMTLGYALTELGMYERALDSFDSALRLDPKQAKAHFLRGNALSLLKRFDEAIEAFRQALALNPELSTARFKLGYLLGQAGRTDEAVRELALGLALLPPNLNAIISLGDLLRGAGRIDEAIERYKSAMEMFAWEALPYAKLAEVYYQKGWQNEAIFMARASLRIDSKKVDCDMLIGRIYMERRLYDEAAEMFQAALNVDKRYPPAKEWLQKARDAKSRASAIEHPAPPPQALPAGASPAEPQHTKKELLKRQIRDLEQGLHRLSERVKRRSQPVKDLTP